MSWLFEEPLKIILIGTLGVAVTAIAWVQSQRNKLLLVAAGLAFVTIGMVMIERVIVTPREEVEATLRGVAQALEANDVAAVEAYLDPAAETLRQEVATRMKVIHVEKISIKRNLEVTLGAGKPPHSARARFNVVATLDSPQAMTERFTVPRLLIVDFRYVGSRWLIVGYEHFDPRGEQAGR